MKRCIVCGVEKELNQYYADKKMRDGKRSNCKDCHKRQESLRQQKTAKARPRKHKDQFVKRVRVPGDPLVNRKYKLMVEYGLSYDDYLGMAAKQNHCCAICLEPVEVFHVDHCHKSGKVRGLLCGPCNRGIGLLKDDFENLIRAANYLKIRG